MSRVLKPSKAEVSKQSIQNEIKAEKSLDKQAQNLIDKSGKFGEKQRNVQKEYEYKMSQFKKTYVHDWKVLKTNLTHLYPYEGLSSSERTNAKIRGLIFAFFFLIVFKNIVKVWWYELKYIPLQFNFIQFTRSMLGRDILYILTFVAIYFLIYRITKSQYNQQLKTLSDELSQMPTIVSNSKKDIKNSVNEATFSNIMHTDDGTAMYENPSRQPIRVESNAFATHLGKDILN